MTDEFLLARFVKMKSKAARPNLAAKLSRSYEGRVQLFRTGRGKAALSYLFVRFADSTRMIASPDGPTFKVPTITGSPSPMLMSVFKPVFS